MKINNSYFGEINLDPNDLTFHIATFVLNGRAVQCRIFIGKTVTLNPIFVKKSSDWLEQLEQVDRTMRALLMSNYEAGNDVIESFIEFHLEEVLEPIQKKLNINEITPRAFLNGMDLCGIGIHVDADNLVFRCDYSIGKEFVDELLVVYSDDKNHFIVITHES